MTIAQNYTDEQVAAMRNEYEANPTRETVEHIAETLGKSVRSVIGKLSNEGIYQKTERTTKNGKPVVTKAEWVNRIQELTNEELKGLEKAPKLTLEKLFHALNH